MAGGAIPDAESNDDEERPVDLWLAEMKYRVATGYW